MRTKKLKEPIKHTSVWWCNTCKSDEMEQPAMLVHLKEAHGLETKGLKCNKKMTMHLDCADSYHSTYEVTFKDHPELNMTNSTASPRENGSWMGDYA